MFSKRKSIRFNPEGEFLELPRGGYVVPSKIGGIQFGVPPETIKDSMAMKIDVPTIYVFPEELWDRKTGINAAEAEFPAYFNYFILKRKVSFVCTKEQEHRIRVVFQETLLGPPEFNTGLVVEKDEIECENSPSNGTTNGTTTASTSTSATTSSTTTTTATTTPSGIIDQSTIDLSSIDTCHYHHHHHQITPQNSLTNLEKLLNNHKASETNENGQEGEQVNEFSDEEKINNQNIDQEFKKEFSSSFPESEIPNLEKEYMINSISTINNEVFDPPTFGITIIGSSHGFDPKKSTTGFVLWINKRGIMVDPPLNSSSFLQNQGVPTRAIDHIILTHCHADHDSGTFQKLLEEYQITVVTTPTILGSFLRKYGALSNLSTDLLRRLFVFRPVMMGEPMIISNAEFRFFYTIHTIPTISFEVFYGGKSIFYSGDTCYDPSRIIDMNQRGIMTKSRMNFFLRPWNHTVVLHEAGVPPIHTPVSVLRALPEEVKNRLYLVHISEHTLPQGSGLKIAKEGVQHTLSLDVIRSSHSEAVDILKLIESVDIFRSIPLTQACEILQTATKRKYSQGSLIIARDTEPDAFYIIASGVVCVTIGDLKKNLIVGDYFGEMSLVMGTLRSANVQAVTDVEVLSFNKEDFLSITRNNRESIDFITKLFEMRNEKSWETMSLNSVLNRCTNSQRTALQSIFTRVPVKKNEYLWIKGEVASFGCLVAEGSFVFEEDDALEPFSKGSFLGDINAMSINPPSIHKTTVVSKEESVIYKVFSKDLVKFFSNNPGIQLAFLDTIFVDALRDQLPQHVNSKLTY
ncbi:hypothetical protein DICPUDRAFT_98774 [Dictyostelium purpureum]|uniref:3',5'-cyclic-GMP phosphodiesterase n=1 Tax=Dictyostelium purpureum TaxID=5786 RepID=F0ZTE3_DICPU|nr:uncharacterized protein DICPUDRAFT_98774 [Dictyostelium purpureum]EGC32794.1 hypothetical protein DICPUDRAFT_98774 [Dictyostelium purpureum]|eukprot:XP_003290682.1 hypothetical protein DICPUDRAFT_98774 [Dictyostelium purpureum]